MIGRIFDRDMASGRGNLNLFPFFVCYRDDEPVFDWLYEYLYEY